VCGHGEELCSCHWKIKNSGQQSLILQRPRLIMNYLWDRRRKGPKSQIQSQLQVVIAWLVYGFSIYYMIDWCPIWKKVCLAHLQGGLICWWLTDIIPSWEMARAELRSTPNPTLLVKPLPVLLLLCSIPKGFFVLVVCANTRW